MFNWLRTQFRRTQTKTLSLVFNVERVDGQHIVQVLKQRDGLDIPVEDVQSLCQYGYKEVEETPEGTVIYVVDGKDLQTLLALRSTNPRFEGNGRLSFDFAPPLLTYLRTKKNLGESEESAKLKVQTKPLAATAQIDFDPQEGLTVTTGYQDPVSQEFVAAADIKKTGNNDYVIVGDTFMLPPQTPDKKTNKWWEQSVTKIAVGDIPEFFQRDFVLLKRGFTAVLTDMAAQIQIIDEPFKPVVKVDKDQRGWLDFEVNYEAGGFTLPHGLLTTAQNESFIQVDEMTWIRNDRKTVAKTEKQLKELEAEITAQGYRAQTSQFASLDEFIKSIGGRAELSAAYQAFLDQLTGFKADESFQLSAAAEQQFKKVGIILRPYQRAGIHWLDWMFSNHLHGLLADDMGLGKTLQSICVLRRAYEESNNSQHSLILSPKSVIHHWEREINAYFPQLHVYPYHGPHRNPDLFQALEPIVFISTYQTAANDLDHLVKVPFFYIIPDEARYLEIDSILDEYDEKENIEVIYLPGTDLEFELAIENDLENMRGDLVNILSWIEEARKEYKRNTRRFAKMRAANPDDYPKHFPPAKLSRKEICEMTKFSKPSLFFPFVSMADLETVMWDAIEEYFKVVVVNDYVDVYLEAYESIGASHGEETNVFHVKIDCVTPLTHMHPVLKRNLPTGTEVKWIEWR